jgi:hypothetical protein
MGLRGAAGHHHERGNHTQHHLPPGLPGLPGGPLTGTATSITYKHPWFYSVSCKYIRSWSLLCLPLPAIMFSRLTWDLYCDHLESTCGVIWTTRLNLFDFKSLHVAETVLILVLSESTCVCTCSLPWWSFWSLCSCFHVVSTIANLRGLHVGMWLHLILALLTLLFATTPEGPWN